MKPMLFNTDMVNAILEGRKTVTRRVVYEPYYIDHADVCMKSGLAMRRGSASTTGMPYPDRPYAPGDILWVRETWQFIPCIDCCLDLNGLCQESPVTYEDSDSIGDGCFIYRADYPEPQRISWRPSIHMPRDAARIFLRVTDVRVERLQDITPEQIDAEGCKEWAYSTTTGELLPSGPSWFRIAWNSTVKPSALYQYGWEANPWVWVIQFERINKEDVVHDT